MTFGEVLENLRTSSESGRKSSENCQEAVISRDVYIIKRTLHVSSKYMNFMFSWQELFLPLEHKIHIFSPLSNILKYLHRNKWSGHLQNIVLKSLKPERKRKLSEHNLSF